MNQSAPWDLSTFEDRLREVGQRAYHDKHPFHLLMNDGALPREAVTGWVINRFYYQRSIPQKDAAILSNLPLREVRRVWLHRITDHDGLPGEEGGIEAWLRLGEACGASREDMLQGRDVEPGVRSSVDAYVAFARTQPWPVAVASSLTEMFVPDLMAKRLDAFQRHYKWIDPAGLDYFRRRLVQAPRDSSEALELTLKYCDTLDLQKAAVGALIFKCNLLWALLDAIDRHYRPRESP
ncbi:MAG: pyrroloquinoline-quinone synthase PqqC [Chthoniobacteraceae bacterium]|jgi:pyrroloquinoline-quinone synthase